MNNLVNFSVVNCISLKNLTERQESILENISLHSTFYHKFVEKTNREGIKLSSNTVEWWWKTKGINKSLYWFFSLEGGIKT
jgi:hypothetical protein